MANGSGAYDISAGHRQHRLDLADLLIGDGQIVR
jgi:hypothetical protein